MDAAVAELVRRRAGDRCEYCLLPQEHSQLTFHIEHIRSVQHGGDDDPENLALACNRCNGHKGSNLSGIDPDTDKLTALYNPRTDFWNDHFEWPGALINRRTPVGRTTVYVLNMNEKRRVVLRTLLLQRGEFK